MNPSWTNLITAWTEFRGAARQPWYRVEAAVNALPEVERAPALAWLQAQIAASPEGPRRTTFASSWLASLASGVPDLRAELFDGIVVDHHAFRANAVIQIRRRAAGLRELSLFASFVEGGVDALFAAGIAWPQLEALSLRECGPLGAVLATLTQASWMDALQSLALEDEAPLAEDALISLLTSVRLPGLRKLCLRPVAPTAACTAWLATTGVLERLETLELELWPRGDAQAALQALASRPMPVLRELTLLTHTTALSKNLFNALLDRHARPRLARLKLRVGSAPPASIAALGSRYPDLDADIEVAG